MTIIDPVGTGITLLTLLAVAYGGTFVLRVVSGGQGANELQRTYFRAGHAHAGMLVTLGLVISMLMSAPGIPGWGRALSTCVLWSAILMPAGFFLSVVGRDPERPNALRHLIWIGGVVLGIGIAAAGISVLSLA